MKFFYLKKKKLSEGKGTLCCKHMHKILKDQLARVCWPVHEGKKEKGRGYLQGDRALILKHIHGVLEDHQLIGGGTNGDKGMSEFVWPKEEPFLSDFISPSRCSC